MNKIFNFLFTSLILIGCMSTAASVRNEIPVQKEQTFEQASDELLELARETDQERVPAIYVVIISQPETITARPLEK